MKKTTSQVFWGLLTAVLGALCIAAVVKSSGMSPAQLQAYMKDADPRWLTGAAICAMGIIYFEGRALLSIVRSIGYRRKERQGFVYACADVFFSAITPSATGGQPASAFFMIRDGMPAAVVTAALLANLLAYNAAILSIGFACLVCFPELFLHFQPVCKLLIIAGILVLAGMGCLFLMLLRYQKPLYYAAKRLLALLQRLHLLRHPEKWEKRLEKTMEEYRAAVRMMAGKKDMWIKAYLFNVMIRVCQFGVSVLTFIAIGGQTDQLRLWATQCYVSLGANCIPLPGAVGVTDYLMLDGYFNLMDQPHAYTLQLLARGLSFYSCVIVSALVILGAYFLGKTRNNINAGNGSKQ